MECVLCVVLFFFFLLLFWLGDCSFDAGAASFATASDGVVYCFNIYQSHSSRYIRFHVLNVLLFCVCVLVWACVRVLVYRVLCECVYVQTLLLCWRVDCLLCVRFCSFFLLSVCFSCTLADDFKLIFNVFVHSTENHTPHWKHFYECLRVRVFAVGFIQLFCFFFFFLHCSKQSES